MRIITNISPLRGVLYLLLITFTIVLFSSCKAITGVKTLPPYDKSIDAEQTATLLIRRNYTVTSFNGQPVKWKARGVIAVIKIPAGDHEIEYDYDYKAGGWSDPHQEIRSNQRVTTQTFTPIVERSFSHKFIFTAEAGKGYIIEEYNVNIYNRPAYQQYIDN